MNSYRSARVRANWTLVLLSLSGIVILPYLADILRVFAPPLAFGGLAYIPTIPNPTSGNMALVLEDDVMETDLTVEDAMKLVFSGGIVLPEAVSLARVSQVEMDHPVFVGRFEPDSD